MMTETPNEQDHAHEERAITAVGGGHNQATETGPPEDRLDEDRARDEAANAAPDDGHHRQERVGKDVAPHDWCLRRLPCPWPYGHSRDPTPRQPCPGEARGELRQLLEGQNDHVRLVTSGSSPNGPIAVARRTTLCYVT